MGRTRDLVKKTGDTKGVFHATMGTIKDRNDKGLTRVYWLDLSHLYGQKERQRRKGKIYPPECRVLENSKEKKESLLK